MREGVFTDEELVERVVNFKDSHSFAILYDRYSEKVYHKCLSFTKSEIEAQDLTHDIFVKLFIKLRSFEKKSSFSTWLYALVYNFCLNYVNRDKPKNDAVSFKEGMGGVEHDYPDSKLYLMKTEKLALALKKMEPNKRAVLLMKYQDDFTIEDIQNAFGISESAAKMRIKRAKQLLVEIYDTITD